MKPGRTFLLVLAATTACADAPERATMEPVRVSDDGTELVGAATGERFVAFGFNYDHDTAGRLLDDYWHDEWPTVAEDFREMAALGANVVRVHLQVGRLMRGPDRVDDTALRQLQRLVGLAEATGLRLDVTGLGCYHAADVPGWYDAATEAERWAIQARFWRAVAAVCAPSPAIFCYDLMNEPILPGVGEVADDWLAGEFGGKHFVQRITLDLAGRTRVEVARTWVETLVGAIREEDPRHMVTVGVIPWALSFPGARPVFYAPEVAAHLDFVSVHFYPKAGEIDAALDALDTYRVGKPLVVEETFPLRCSSDELVEFVRRAGPSVDGWISFYWGRTPAETASPDVDLAGAITREWLLRFAALARSFR